MRTAYPAHPGSCEDPGTSAFADAKIDRELVTRGRLPRVTPPLPFEVEEFHSEIPEENWRHRPGVSQTLDLPSVLEWRASSRPVQV